MKCIVSLQKSVKERFFHALWFEVLAIALCAPLGAWLLGYSLAHMGLLTLMVSLMAMSAKAEMADSSVPVEAGKSTGVVNVSGSVQMK